MANADVSSIQKTLAVFIDQSATAPTEGTADWNFRLELINRTQKDWADSYDWPQLYRQVFSLTSNTSTATIPMVADFRKLATKFVLNDGLSTKEYVEVEPQLRFRQATSDKFVYVMGDPRNSYNLIINPATMASGASIFYGYWASPGSLPSGSSVSAVPDENFIIQRTLAYYWQAKEDGRFQDARVESDKILARMIEKVTAMGYGFDSTVRSQDQAYRWGDS